MILLTKLGSDIISIIAETGSSISFIEPTLQILLQTIFKTFQTIESYMLINWEIQKKKKNAMIMSALEEGVFEVD